MKSTFLILALVTAVQAAPLIAPAANQKAIPDSYIIVLNKDMHALSPNGSEATASAFKAKFDALAKNHNGRNGGPVPTIHREFSSAISGFHATLDATTLKAIQADPDVAYIEQDAVVNAYGVQPNPPATWGLVRISQHVRDLTKPYYYNDLAGQGVTAYIIDTGILTTHTDFGGRAVMGANFVSGSPNTDENGHGTHLAGVIGGTIYGVAKKVKLVGIKVLNAQGSGSTSGVVAGMDYVAANAVAGKTVVNMSLGGGTSTAINDAAQRLYAKNAPLFAAAGGSASTACTGSPGGAPNVYTVASTDSTDHVASFSSTGPCVEIFAPGVGIKSTWIGSNSATNTVSGTSMSTAFVTGAAALFAAQGGLNTAQAVYNVLSAQCTTGVITGNLGGAPNCLVYNGGP
ncbi:subtilisin-like serine protease-like protein PR1A [Linnemannia elongata AG-77]|uniref:Subtilisin-like serine protease-like protein PR1A n=1 Tax=Linnemannia elongata AG-77 TaxID=1314771 RepID=A0A197JZK1_9FUNG|nr:subtilisin-like serine protease-like protein PR1A [Linnemannia elongata AG-77]